MGSRIIERHHIQGSIVDLVRAAKSEICLVSPYIGVWGHLDSDIDEALRKNLKVSLIYRRSERDKYKDSVTKLVERGVRAYDVENLHAKLYASESACIITSMNLYDHSAQNNEELAIFSDEPSLVTEAGKYVKYLLGRAEERKPKSLASKLTVAAGKVAVAAGANAVKLIKDSFRDGYCLRCGKRLESYDAAHPFCDPHQHDWNKWKNKDYEEKFCHACGKQHKTSVSRPVCYDCYKKQAAAK